MAERDYLVEVCADCLRAECVYSGGICAGYWRAGTAKVRASDLRAMAKEDERQYSRERILLISGVPPIDISD